MRKQEFLAHLRNGLSGLEQEEINERLTFYSEMIDDRTEEGLSEEEAVAAVGSVDELVAQIISETPKPVTESIKPKRHLKAWEIVLLVLGSPIWLSLGIAAVAVVCSLYASAWAVIVSLWAVFVSVLASTLSGVLGGVIFLCIDTSLSGLTMLAAGLVCAGLSVLTFFACKAITKGILMLTKNIALWIKGCFVRKEDV